MSQIVHNSGITYGNDNRNCGNTGNIEYNQCNISIPDEKRQILEWISPFASRERHQAVRDSRVEKVGDWLLCNKSFSTWRASKDKIAKDQMAKPVLFCHGNPGAGKTYISSLVIDTLHNGIDGDGVVVAYVYCDFSTRNMQSAGAVLGSVLRQVVGALAEIPDEVQKAFERAKKQADGCGLRLPEILNMLTRILPGLERAFICVDALDEFPIKQRAQLWDSLQRVVRECANTRLFLTGRPQIRTEVEDYLPEEADMVAIEPTSEDIGRYIEERLKGDLDKSTIDEGLREEIRRVIPRRVSGMFLLVCLGMDAILGATTIRQKRQALDRMANGLGVQDAYNTTLDRIRQQDGGKSKLGMSVLMWVSRCERPLRWEELRHALGVDLGVEGFTIDNVPSIRTVLGCTLGLVTIDESVSTVRLLHLTLQEYLGASPTIFQTPQSMMAEICLAYLDSPSAREPQLDFLDAQKSWPFLNYASCFWGTHAAREVTEQVKSRALQLLDGYESHVSATALWRGRIRKWRDEWFCHGISGLHCIAFLGIAEIAVAMLEKGKWDVNGRDFRGDTPLMWAIRYGNDRVVELLLEQGDIRPDMVIRDGRTVFSFAAELGNEGAVKLLLERGGANPDLSDSYGRTPLSFAALGGHEGVAKLLLGRGDVNPNSSDKLGRTPIWLAALGGREGVAKLLLGRRDVNPNSLDSNGLAPLSYAVLRGHGGVVKLLLGRGDVSLNSLDRNGLTPLLYAAVLGDENIVKLLVEHGSVNPDSHDSGGSTRLPSATISGAEGVELHLERAGLDLRGGDGQALLSFAAGVGENGLVRVLLERWGVDPDSPDSSLRTPLSLAALRGHEDTVRLLLQRGDVDPNSPDSNGLTPLSLAVSGGSEGTVRLLLERGDTNPNSPDSNGLTPLSLAVSGGSEGTVRLLLERGDTNPNSPDSNGLTPLSLAASGGRDGIVSLLLKREDVNPNLPDSNSLTPLSLAASRGHEDIVGLLLAREDTNPDSPDCCRRTPLSFAAEGGHEGVVKLLLERHEVNPYLADSSGRTPLSFATLGEHGSVVRILQGRGDVYLNTPAKDGSAPMATSVHTPTPSFISPSPSVSVLSPRSTASAAPDTAPSKPSTPLKRKRSPPPQHPR